MRLPNRRALRGAGRIALMLAILLFAGAVVNIALMGYAVFKLSDTAIAVSVQKASNALKITKDGYVLDNDISSEMKRHDRWAMLIDLDGNVIWSYRLPKSLERTYSLTDVAVMSRWYLDDYPIKVWTRHDGLFVLGYPKNTLWKYSIDIPAGQLEFWPGWILIVIVVNSILIAVVSVFAAHAWHKRRDVARGAWISAVSHDIRTPLSMVMGYAGSMESDSSLSNETRERARVIRKNGEAMRALISDLNLTNRLTYAMEPLNKRIISPASLIRETVSELLNEGFESSVEIDISPDAEQSRVEADPALLKRALLNLLLNSHRHNKYGCQIEISLIVEKTDCVLSVADDGAGYPDETLKKLRRGDFALTTNTHGLGLGIVSQIVEAHLWKVAFENNSRGSACRIHMRRAA